MKIQPSSSLLQYSRSRTRFSANKTFINEEKKGKKALARPSVASDVQVAAFRIENKR
jgi:hypothetical protein